MFYLTDLESERIKFRPLSSDDATKWTHFLEDPVSTQFFAKLDMTPAQRAESWIQSQLDRYEQGTYGMCGLNLKETGEFIGQCGLLTQQVNGVEEIEIGYHLFREHTGHGYATEAAQHLKKFAFSNGLCESLVSIIDEFNFSSQAVAKRNGMVEDYRTKWKDMNVIIYRVSS